MSEHAEPPWEAIVIYDTKWLSRGTLGNSPVCENYLNNASNRNIVCAVLSKIEY